MVSKKRWRQGSRIVWMWMVKERCNRLHRTMEGFIATNCIRDEAGVIGETTKFKERHKVLVAACVLPSVIFMVRPPLTLLLPLSRRRSAQSMHHDVFTPNSPKAYVLFLNLLSIHTNKALQILCSFSIKLARLACRYFVVLPIESLSFCVIA